MCLTNYENSVGLVVVSKISEEVVVKIRCLRAREVKRHGREVGTPSNFVALGDRGSVGPPGRRNCVSQRQKGTDSRYKSRAQPLCINFRFLEETIHINSLLCTVHLLCTALVNEKIEKVY